VIDALPKSQFKVIPSMSFGRFSELLKNAACIVGNSSAGVREAPFLGVPSLDVGSRQSDRAFGVSITKVDAEQQDEIARFLQQNWHNRHPRQTEFGHGNATQKFIHILKSDAFWLRSMQKYFNDFAP